MIWATPLSLSCIGEGNGSPLQCSCLENPRDGGAWWAAVYGVAQSRKRLKRFGSSVHLDIMQIELSTRITGYIVFLPTFSYRVITTVSNIISYMYVIIYICPRVSQRPGSAPLVGSIRGAGKIQHTGPGGRLRGKGRIGRQVAVQRPGARRSSRGQVLSDRHGDPVSVHLTT